MKKLKMTLALLFISTSAFSAVVPTLVFNEVYLKKDLKSENDIYYVANRNLLNWCTGTGSSIGIGSFEAAVAIDGLSDGLFKCDGNFVQVVGDRSNAIQIFDISNCSSVNPIELKAECPKK